MSWIDPEQERVANIQRINASMRTYQRQGRRMSAALPKIENGPPSGAFVPAEWRGTTRINPKTGEEIGVSFNTAEGVIRLLMSLPSARQAAESILYELGRVGTNSQSPISPGAPNVAVSTPDDGVKV